jgi:hypothetical protein
MIGVVVLDPALLAIPNMAGSEEEVERIFATVTEWSKQIFHHWPIRVVQPTRTAEVLAAAGAFPAGENIRQLLEMCHLEHVFSGEDIRRAVTAILSQCSTAAEVIGSEADDCSLGSADPDIFEPYTPPAMRDAMVRACATSLLYEPSKVESWVAPGVPQSVPEIRFRCQVDTLSPPKANTSVPYSSFGRVRLAERYEALVDAISASRAWQFAEGQKDICLAIAAEALTLLRVENPLATMRDVGHFAVGSAFLDSLAHWQADGNREFSNVVRESCARIVLGKPKQAVGFLRQGNKPIKRSDGAIAKRTHLTKKGVGLRLMFWDTAKGVEFANIGSKNELSIAEGTAHKAAAFPFN